MNPKVGADSKATELKEDNEPTGLCPLRGHQRRVEVMNPHICSGALEHIFVLTYGPPELCGDSDPTHLHGLWGHKSVVETTNPNICVDLGAIGA